MCAIFLEINKRVTVTLYIIAMSSVPQYSSHPSSSSVCFSVAMAASKLYSCAVPSFSCFCSIFYSTFYTYMLYLYRERGTVITALIIVSFLSFAAARMCYSCVFYVKEKEDSRTGAIKEYTGCKCYCRPGDL